MIQPPEIPVKSKWTDKELWKKRVKFILNDRGVRVLGTGYLLSSTHSDGLQRIAVCYFSVSDSDYSTIPLSQEAVDLLEISQQVQEADFEVLYAPP